MSGESNSYGFVTKAGRGLPAIRGGRAVVSVDDWARREMAKDADDWPVDYEAEAGAGNAFQRGIVHAFSALLSDEAVEAAARRLFDGKVWNFELDEARDALEAAVRAVTEGESE